MHTRGDSGSLEAPTSGEQYSQSFSQKGPVRVEEACGPEGVERKIADRQAGKALCLIPCGGVDGQGSNVPCVQCRYEAAIVC